MHKIFLFSFFVFGFLYGYLSAKSREEPFLTFPLQWKFSLPRQTIILTGDQQLPDLEPDKKINTSLGPEQRYGSLREIREKARQRGCRTVILAFDNFFRQYGKDAGMNGNLPDSDECIARIQKISRFLGEQALDSNSAC